MLARIGDIGRRVRINWRGRRLAWRRIGRYHIAKGGKAVLSLRCRYAGLDSDAEKLKQGFRETLVSLGPLIGIVPFEPAGDFLADLL